MLTESTPRARQLRNCARRDFCWGISTNSSSNLNGNQNTGFRNSSRCLRIILGKPRGIPSGRNGSGADYQRHCSRRNHSIRRFRMRVTVRFRPRAAAREKRKTRRRAGFHRSFFGLVQTELRFTHPSNPSAEPNSHAAAGTGIVVITKDTSEEKLVPANALYSALGF